MPEALRLAAERATQLSVREATLAQIGVQRGIIDGAPRPPGEERAVDAPGREDALFGYTFLSILRDYRANLATSPNTNDAFLCCVLPFPGFGSLRRQADASFARGTLCYGRRD